MLRRWLRLRSLKSEPIIVRGPEALRPVADALAGRLRAGDVVYLEGPIGAGKTTFAQALGAALGVREPITSPTYVLVHRYDAPVPVVHVDLYRLDTADGRSRAEVVAEIDSSSIALVEWPELASGILPAPTWRVRLAFADETARRVEIDAAD